jgi:hypothetical protein
MSWSGEEIEDLVYEMVSQVTPDKIILAAAGADNDKEFRGWLRVVLRTTLDQRARRTQSGRIIRRVDDALREDRDRFVLRSGHWGLVGDDRVPDSGELDD